MVIFPYATELYKSKTEIDCRNNFLNLFPNFCKKTIT